MNDYRKPAEGPSESDALRSLLRQYGPKPPYEAVDWNQLERRVATAAEPGLARRRIGLAGAERGNRPEPWWVVAAGWVRPAVLTAAAVAAAAAIAIATTGLQPASTTPTGANATVVTADADPASMLGSGGVVNADVASIASDSMFSALTSSSTTP
jgi:hypothetical protein